METSLCSFSECGRSKQAAGLCTGHYAQQWNGKPLTPLRQCLPRAGRTCSFDGCDKQPQGRGLCDAHLKQAVKGQELRPLRPKTTKPPGPDVCSAPECIRRRYSNTVYCHPHYQQTKRGETLRPVRISNRGPCLVDGCAEHAYVYGICRQHWEFAPWGSRKPHCSGYIYVLVASPEGARTRTEHRVLMELAIGRSLEPDETVHHINGTRHDNRLENLELWVRGHGAGQRVDDRVRDAVATLKRYAPDLLVVR